MIDRYRPVTIRTLRDALAAWVGRTGLNLAARIRSKR